MFPPAYSPSFTPNFHLELFTPLGVGWREDATAGVALDQNFAIIDAALGSGGGSSVYVNAAKITSPNFNDSAPAAPGGYGNVVWQVTGSSVSAYVPLQVNADWNASSGLAQILNKPTIPAAQVQTDWNAVSGIGVLLNKPTLATVATSGSYSDLSSKPTLAATTAAVSHQWLTSYNATTGAFGQAQPAAADLSDSASSAGYVLRANGTSFVSAQLGYGDISGTPSIPTSFAWNVEGNAAGNLTLANAGFATTFNQTSAVNWTWANTTAATATAAGASSPILNLSGTYFTLGASAVDTWTIQDVLTAPHTSATVTNMAETAASVVTLTITGGNFVIGDVITFTGLTKATWLNGQNATITNTGGSSPTETSVIFTDPVAGHNPTTTGAETGQVTQANPRSTLTIGQGGSGGSFVLGTAGININQTNPVGTASGFPSLFFGGNSATGIGAVGTPPSSQLSFYSGSSRFNWFQGVLQHSLSMSAGGFVFVPLTANVTMGITGNQSATASTVGVSLGNAVNINALSGTQDLVRIGAYSGGSVANLATFNPAYGTGTFNALNIAPVINQAALTNTIVGTEVIANVAAVVFTAVNTWTNGSTTDTVAAGVNTGINGTQNITTTTTVSRATVTVTNSVETSGNAVTLTVGTHAIVANDYCYISGMTTMTWLNGKAVKITSVVANTSITFTDPTSHGTQATGADTGTVVTSYIKYSKTTGAVALTQDTGTATQQAIGTYTVLNIAVTETSLGGTPNYLINALAGAAGTTQVFAVDNLGAMYLAKAAAGAPTSVGTAGTIGQIVRYGGVLYFCSVTGAAGSATWNSLNMTAV